MDEHGVARSEDAGDFRSRLASEEVDVLEPSPQGIAPERRTLSAVTHDEEGGRLAPGGLRGVQDALETVRHPYGSHVRQQELLPSDAELVPEIVVSGPRCELRKIDPILHDGDLRPRDPSLAEYCGKGVRHGDDPVGVAIEIAGESAQGTCDEALRRCSDGDDRFRPQVSELKDTGGASQSADDPRPEDGEKLRGCSDDDVGPRLEQAGGNGAQHVAHVVERAPELAGIGGDVGPDPHDPDPGHVLQGERPVPVPVVNPARGEVGDAGDDRHLVSLVDPDARVLERTSCGRVRLGREVVRKEEDPHGPDSTPTANELQAPLRSQSH